MYRSFSSYSGHSATATPIVEFQNIQEKMQAIAEHKLVVVDIFADWCSPCKKIEPQYAEMAKSFAGNRHILFAKENLDNGITKNLGSIPFFQIFLESKLVDTVSGGNLGEVYAKVQTQLQKMENPDPSFGGGNAIRNVSISADVGAGDSSHTTGVDGYKSGGREPIYRKLNM